MSEFRAGVVVPVGPGRLENTKLMLEHLDAMPVLPEAVVLVFDGPAAAPQVLGEFRDYQFPVVHLALPARREPGEEQLRNLGVRRLLQFDPDVTHAWFLDSDVLVDSGALAAYEIAREPYVEHDPIMFGPYLAHLAQGQTRPDLTMREALRAEHFAGEPVFWREPGTYAALSCFSGNLVWPIHRFMDVGGFHPLLYRTEDGELGVRAAAHRVSMLAVPAARGWHLWHPVDHAAIAEANAREVPLINSWWSHDSLAKIVAGERIDPYPDTDEQGRTVADPDGVRAAWECERCGETIRASEMWGHATDCLLAPVPVA